MDAGLGRRTGSQPSVAGAAPRALDRKSLADQTGTVSPSRLGGEREISGQFTFIYGNPKSWNVSEI